MNNTYQVQTTIAILGGGPAGYVAAVRAAQLGAEVVLIEESEIGGVCLNKGCIPTKAYLRTSEIAYLIGKSNEFGLNAGLSSVNWKIALDRKDRVVKNLRIGLEGLLEGSKVQIFRGRGKIVNSQQIKVYSSEKEILVNCKKMIITTGSEPIKPAIPGMDLKDVLTSDEALMLHEIPERMVIIGAGAIGLEFASMFNHVGTKVTVVEVQEMVLPREDRELAEELCKALKRQGITFKLGGQVLEIKKAESGLEVVIQRRGKISSLMTDKILVSVGRKLNVSDDIGALGIHIKDGAVVVNENMQTNIEDVYAAGDIVGGKLLAHLAFAQGRKAAENALGLKSTLNNDTVPSCVYTNPELASVGIDEKEAERRGIEVLVGCFQIRNNGRALCIGEREGAVKIIVKKDSKEILGAQILSSHASEMISELTLAVTLGVKADVIAQMIHPHPTLGEAIMEACGDAIGRAIHKS